MRTARLQPIDLAAAMDRFDGDLPYFVEALREFLDLMPDRVRSIDEAVRRGDGVQLRAIAHNLRGAAGNLGADAVSEMVFTIEKMGTGVEPSRTDRHLESLRLEIARIEKFMGEITGEAT